MYLSRSFGLLRRLGVLEFRVVAQIFQGFLGECLIAQFLGGLVGLPIRFRANLGNSLIGDIDPLIGAVGFLEQFLGSVGRNGGLLGRLLPIDLAEQQVGLAGGFTAEGFVA